MRAFLHVASALLMAATAASGCSLLRPDVGAPEYGSGAGVAVASPERRAEQATVRIRNLGCNALSTGSGVVVGPHELLTNAHVIAGAEKLEITTWDGTTVDARVEGAAVASDLARVRVDAALPAAAELADGDPDVGAALVVFGFPEGGRFSAERGALVGYADVDGQRSMVMTNRVRPGNSGGPVFGVDGRVVGLVRALLVQEDQGVAIPASAVTPMLAATAGSGRVPGCDAFRTEDDFTR